MNKKEVLAQFEELLEQDNLDHDLAQVMVGTTKEVIADERVEELEDELVRLIEEFAEDS